MAEKRKPREIFFPPVNRKTVIRIALTAVIAYAVFGYVCIPVRFSGRSMEPTYQDGGVGFCLRFAYLFSAPERGDVVFARFSGTKVMLLKRVVAKAGETVEFRNGVLYVNGVKLEEPYVRYPCDWNLPPRKVGPNHVYVVGDNRSVPIERHDFGQVSENRIMGVPLW